MIYSFVFAEGKVAGRDLELNALKLVRSDKGLFIWVDLEAPTDEEIQLVLVDMFGFHPVAVDECVTESAQPKVEDYEDYLFLTMHGVTFSKENSFQTMELNCFLGRDYLVTFHRKDLPAVKAIRDRCGNHGAPVTARGPDRLLYLVLDHLVDNYQPVLREFSRAIDSMEERLLEQSDLDQGIVAEIVELRKELSQLRQITRPQEEVAYRLSRGEGKLIRASLLPYFRNLTDNLHRVDVHAGSFADQLLLSMDLYVNKVAFQTNEGIKVLTALTALTLPPVLVGSWYGMNFTDMPELASRYGYEGATIVTLMGMGAVWWWLKRKKWI